LPKLKTMNMKLFTETIPAEIAYCEAKGISKAFMAYANNCPGETINELGFNPNSGYVYLALENGICICSNMGQDVEYLINNYRTGEEIFYDDYEDAYNHEELI
jgi:hypothetical protein